MKLPRWVLICLFAVTSLFVTLGGVLALREWYFHGVVQQLTEFVRNTAVWDSEHLDPVLTAGRPTITHLIRALSDGDSNVRRVACFALGCQGDDAKPAVSELIRILADEEVGVRSEAAIALGEIGAGATPALPWLAEMWKDSSIQVRFCAAKSLWQIDGSPHIIVPWLIAMIQDETDEEEARYTAAKLLGEIGSDARAAILVLLEAQKDAEAPLHMVLIEAIRKIVDKNGDTCDTSK